MIETAGALAEARGPPPEGHGVPTVEEAERLPPSSSNEVTKLNSNRRILRQKTNTQLITWFSNNNSNTTTALRDY